MGVPSGSFASQLGIDLSSPIGVAYDFISCDLAMDEQLIRPNGMSGTRSRHGERVRGGLQRIGGPLEMEPNDGEWKGLLPWVLGANASGSTYALAEVLQTRFVTIDRVAKVFTYDKVGVDTAKIHASQGEPLKLSLGLVGSTETIGNAGSFPNVSESESTQPFILADLVITVAGVTIPIKSFDLTINNHIDKDRFFNSNHLYGILANDRETVFETMLPYDSVFYSVYGSGFQDAGTPPAPAVVATLTNGAVSMVISLGFVAFPRKAPNVGNRQEILLPIRGECYQTSSTKEVVITMT